METREARAAHAREVRRSEANALAGVMAGRDGCSAVRAESEEECEARRVIRAAARLLPELSTSIAADSAPEDF
jgi:hypothetical protein